MFPIEKDMFTSCEFIYQLFLHVSPSDVTCKGVLVLLIEAVASGQLAYIFFS